MSAQSSLVDFDAEDEDDLDATDDDLGASDIPQSDRPNWPPYSHINEDSEIDYIWLVLQLWGDDYSEILRRDELGDAECTSETPYGTNRDDQ